MILRWNPSVLETVAGADLLEAADDDIDLAGIESDRQADGGALCPKEDREVGVVEADPWAEEEGIPCFHRFDRQVDAYEKLASECMEGAEDFYIDKRGIDLFVDGDHSVKQVVCVVELGREVA